MADFSALKTAIQAYIRTNGNEEITGAILQDILLSMVTTMGDGAINDLAEALQAEITNRQNAVGGEATSRAEADSQLSGRINAEAQARGEADTQLDNSITAITTRLNEGYVYAGIATPSTNPGTPTGKVFYIALQSGTYTNFSSLTVTQGINILKYNGTAWSQEQLVGIDDVPTKESNKLVKSGGVFANMGAFDISDYHKSGSTLATYADLTAALAALPSDFQKGGMSIKFVQSSDNNYVQFRLMAQSFTTDTTKWQGVDDEPVAGSLNLVESGGVNSLVYLSPLSKFYVFDQLPERIGTITGSHTWVTAPQTNKHKIIPVNGGTAFEMKASASKQFFYAVLRDYPEPIVSGSTPDYSHDSNFTHRLACGANNTVQGQIPSDGKYLFIAVQSQNNDILPPVKIVLDGIDYITETVFDFIKKASTQTTLNSNDIVLIKTILNNTEKTVSVGSNNLITSGAVSEAIYASKLSKFYYFGELPEHIGAIVSGGTWNKNIYNKHKIIPIKGGEDYKIVAANNNNGNEQSQTLYYAVLKSYNYDFVEYGIPDFSQETGYTTRRFVAQGQTATGTFPSDGRFLYIATGSPNPDLALPSSIVIDGHEYVTYSFFESIRTSEILTNDCIKEYSGKVYTSSTHEIGSIVLQENNANGACYAIPVKQGWERTIIYSIGGAAARLWYFVDRDMKLISCADSSARAEDLTLTAPANAAYLLVNNIQNNLSKAVFLTAISSVNFLIEKYLKGIGKKNIRTVAIDSSDVSEVAMDGNPPERTVKGFMTNEVHPHIDAGTAARYTHGPIALKKWETIIVESRLNDYDAPIALINDDNTFTRLFLATYGSSHQYMYTAVKDCKLAITFHSSYPCTYTIYENDYTRIADVEKTSRGYLDEEFSDDLYAEKLEELDEINIADNIRVPQYGEKVVYNVTNQTEFDNIPTAISSIVGTGKLLQVLIQDGTYYYDNDFIELTDNLTNEGVDIIGIGNVRIIASKTPVSLENAVSKGSKAYSVQFTGQFYPTMLVCNSDCDKFYDFVNQNELLPIENIEYDSEIGYYKISNTYGLDENDYHDDLYIKVFNSYFVCIRKVIEINSSYIIVEGDGTQEQDWEFTPRWLRKQHSSERFCFVNLNDKHIPYFEDDNVYVPYSIQDGYILDGKSFVKAIGSSDDNKYEIKSLNINNIHFVGGDRLIYMDYVDSDCINIENCTFDHVNNHCVYQWNTSNLRVCDNTGRYLSRSLVYAHLISGKFVINGNKVYDAGHDSYAYTIQATGDTGVIRGNVLINCYMGSIRTGLEKYVEFGTAPIVIEENEVGFDSNSKRIHYVRDFAGIYSLGSNFNCIIRDNFIYDMVAYNDLTCFGIYLDNGNRNTAVYRNLVLGTKTSFGVMAPKTQDGVTIEGVTYWQINRFIMNNIVENGVRFECSAQNTDTNLNGGNIVIFDDVKPQVLYLNISNVADTFVSKCSRCGKKVSINPTFKQILLDIGIKNLVYENVI